MSTFLQLCQKLARESGTAGSGQPVTVVNQSGRLAKMVNWVSDAWVQIQDSRRDWLFLRRQFYNTLSVGSGVYTAASWSLSDWGEWIGDRTDSQEPEYPNSIYDPDIGPGDEAALVELPWPQFRARYIVGAQVNARPSNYCLAPDGSIYFGPAPDKAYKVRGEYIATAQVLAVNTDVPIIPARFHDVIVWRALRRLSARDEAPLSMQGASQDEIGLMVALERNQLPKIKVRRGAMA